MAYAISSVVRYININGGFTVIGWYKRGVIIDKILVSQNVGRTGTGNNGNQLDDVQVDNGEVNFHFICIVPTSSSFLIPTLA